VRAYCFSYAAAPESCVEALEALLQGRRGLKAHRARGRDHDLGARLGVAALALLALADLEGAEAGNRKALALADALGNLVEGGVDDGLDRPLREPLAVSRYLLDQLCFRHFLLDPLGLGLELEQCQPVSLMVVFGWELPWEKKVWVREAPIGIVLYVGYLNVWQCIAFGADYIEAFATVKRFFLLLRLSRPFFAQKRLQCAPGPQVDAENLCGTFRKGT